MKSQRKLENLLAVKERKGRFSRANSAQFEIAALLRTVRTQHSDPETQKIVYEFSVIRASTLLEVFSRDWVEVLLDLGTPYIGRSMELFKDLRLDLEYASALHGRQVTLGEIAAHQLKLSSLDAHLSVFERLTDGEFRKGLPKSSNRLKSEVAKEESKPIVDDVGRVLSSVSHLLATRHILVHELPREAPYTLTEIEPLLTDLHLFVSAANEILSSCAFGAHPLTQGEMNMQASELAEDAQFNLDSTLQAVLSIDQIPSSAILKAQEAWVAYCSAESEARAALVECGSLYPMVLDTERASLIFDRIEKLNWWLQREEGEF